MTKKAGSLLGNLPFIILGDVVMEWKERKNRAVTHKLKRTTVFYQREQRYRTNPFRH